MTASTELVDYCVRGHAAWITLNSPATRNALSGPLLMQLLRCMGDAVADTAVRSIVLTGRGRAFCAGADLKQGGVSSGDQDAAAQAYRDHPLVRVLESMRTAPKPVLCVVNGAAFGGGLGLVAAADIVLAAEDAKMSFSEVRLGVVPAIISVVVLPKLGSHQARRLFLTGQRFTAADAVGYGLVHRALPAGAALDAAVAEELAALHRGGPEALAHAKRIACDVPAMPLQQAYDQMTALSLSLFASPEAAEGMTAFLQKRAPRWAPTDE